MRALSDLIKAVAAPQKNSLLFSRLQGLLTAAKIVAQTAGKSFGPALGFALFGNLFG